MKIKPCPFCGASGPSVFSEVKARERWNKRMTTKKPKKKGG